MILFVGGFLLYPYPHGLFRAERLYLMFLSVAKAMLRNGIISERELAELDAIVLNKYQPVLGTLLAGKPLV